jgi:hypothetical protein
LDFYGRVPLFKDPLRLVVTAWYILEISCLEISRLEERVMIIGCLGVRTIEHRVVDSRGGLKLDESWLLHFLITRHGEERSRFGLEALLELVCEVLSKEDRRVGRVVDYERGVGEGERLKTIVRYGRQIAGFEDKLISN